MFLRGYFSQGDERYFIEPLSSVSLDEHAHAVFKDDPNEDQANSSCGVDDVLWQQGLHQRVVLPASRLIVCRVWLLIGTFVLFPNLGSNLCSSFHIYVCCMCMHICIHDPICVCGDPKLMSSVFLQWSPTYILSYSFLMSSEPAIFDSLPSQLVLGIPHLCPFCTWIKDRLPHLQNFHSGFGDLKSSPHIFTGRVLSAQTPF